MASLLHPAIRSDALFSDPRGDRRRRLPQPGAASVLAVAGLLLVATAAQALDFDPDDYDYAYEVIVSTGAALPAGYPVMFPLDTAALIAAGQLLPGAWDLRIVYIGGVDPVELDRHIRHLGASDAEIWFALQAPIAAGGNDGLYRLYHGNPGETNEPPSSPGAVFPPSVDAGTVAAWYYEEGAGIAVGDASGNGHDGETGPVGSYPGWAEGCMGGAIDFAYGSLNNYVMIPDDPGLRLAAGTYETWVRFNHLDSNQYLFSKDHLGFTTGGHLGIYWHAAIAKLEVRLQSLDTSYYVHGDGGGQIAAGAWHHVAFTFGPAGMHLYVDGVEQVEVNPYTGGTETNDNFLALGAGTQSYPNTPFRDHLIGLMDGTRISDFQRTDYPHATWPCGESPEIMLIPLTPVTVAPTTWGAIKAAFQ